MTFDGIIKAADQVGNTGFAGSTGADQGYHFARCHREADGMQYRIAAAVFEVDLVKNHLALDNG